MAAYRRVYDSRHLQADCQEPGSAPEPYAQLSSTGYLYLFIITPPPAGELSIVMSMSVGLSVCLSVREHISRTTRAIFTKFLCTLSMVVARSSSGGVVIRLVLPVLWMTSYFLISQGCSTSLPS